MPEWQTGGFRVIMWHGAELAVIWQYSGLCHSGVDDNRRHSAACVIAESWGLFHAEAARLWQEQSNFRDNGWAA